MISEKIRQLREKRGWSQEGFAERFGVHRVTVSKWENAGPGEFPEGRIPQLAEFFGVDESELRKASEEQSSQGLTDEPTDESGDWINQWRTLAIHKSADLLPDDAPQRARDTVMLALMAMPMDPFWEDGVSSFTLKELADRAHIDREILEDNWEYVLESDFVRRVGRGEWTVKLTLPEGHDS
jgi:transcriptional regulator with XRE-family HTH domain